MKTLKETYLEQMPDHYFFESYGWGYHKAMGWECDNSWHKKRHYKKVIKKMYLGKFVSRKEEVMLYGEGFDDGAYGRSYE